MLNEEFINEVNQFLIHETDFLKIKDTLSEDQLRAFVDQAILRLCKQRGIKLELEQRAKIIRTMVSAVVSLGPLRPLMEDKSVTEIMVNGAKQIFIQRDGSLVKTDIVFDDNAHLMHTVQKILAGAGTNKRVDESSPYVDFSLPDGSRVNIIIPPLSTKGPIMTIRKFRDDITQVEDLVSLGEINENIAELLVSAMKAKLNVVFCGATGAGKTTALNVFSKHIPEEERIITIEDTPELLLVQEHVVNLLTKPPNIEGKGEITMRDLFINSLRMRPDRIIVGEVRSGEMLDLIESISSGHSGSLAIVHAETPEDCFNRMVTMMLMTGIQLSTEEIQKQIARAIDLMVHIGLHVDGRRRVEFVTDLRWDQASRKVVFHDIFKFEALRKTEEGMIEGRWNVDRSVPSFLNKYQKRRVPISKDLFDIKEE
jgi:pilus assembly protein CpaF